ncbi:hypothetical protein HanPSC8_Chr09g0396001 [Helianthus annuus]|nr:hypothetical protein HanPSC8_Chr09g0396001 [Helianthus annuus]
MKSFSCKFYSQIINPQSFPCFVFPRATTSVSASSFKINCALNMRESQHLPMKKPLNLHTSLINAATTTCMRDSFKGLHLYLLEPLISRRFLNRNRYVSDFFSFFLLIQIVNRLIQVRIFFVLFPLPCLSDPINFRLVSIDDTSMSFC